MSSQKIQKVHPPFHFVLFPFMAQGYMIPMVDIARLLVQHGVTITIVTTPHQVEGFNNVLNRAIKAVPVRTDEKAGDWMDFLDEMVEADNTSYGVIINTFQELEPAYVKERKEARDRKVWSIGHVSLCNKKASDKAERGNKAVIDQEECFKWVDSKEEASVLYVCLGSICNLPLSQLEELGLGLGKSQRPFIWVIRGWDKYSELAEWLLERGFEERNSTLEGITSGVPLLTWPLLGDQFFNQKLVVEVLKVGVGAGIEEERRRRAKELGELAHMAVDEGGSSHSNITFLLQDISQLAQSKKWLGQ
ncbi:hypothetical protein F2Q68_00031996 [Brassica cretica]|uniref:UDP-glycosyltransferases domain-containing protein n=1 Tax=Brassica cretica TaxID=69181 RepID=A0A8S9GHJ1_BRACR|nr:hypothetical protein F2Q68_00031996 [Brassica cretica]